MVRLNLFSFSCGNTKIDVINTNSEDNVVAPNKHWMRPCCFGKKKNSRGKIVFENKSNNKNINNSHLKNNDKIFDTHEIKQEDNIITINKVKRADITQKKDELTIKTNMLNIPLNDDELELSFIED